MKIILASAFKEFNLSPKINRYSTTACNQENIFRYLPQPCKTCIEIFGQRKNQSIGADDLAWMKNHAWPKSLLNKNAHKDLEDLYCELRGHSGTTYSLLIVTFIQFVKDRGDELLINLNFTYDVKFKSFNQFVKDRAANFRNYLKLKCPEPVVIELNKDAPVRNRGV